jgi:hypothetical protein
MEDEAKNSILKLNISFFFMPMLFGIQKFELKNIYFFAYKINFLRQFISIFLFYFPFIIEKQKNNLI